MDGRLQLHRDGTAHHMTRPWTVIDLPTPGSRPLLERMVFSGIVFNMSWEDPEMDRRAFNITPRDAVISITSAGCNPLNFLAQSPARLISVDGNPAQNAVLELKLATIATQDHDTFFDIFAARRPAVVSPLYQRDLRPLLSDQSRVLGQEPVDGASRPVQLRQDGTGGAAGAGHAAARRAAAFDHGPLF